MCKLPVSEDPHLWPVLQTEWVVMPKAVSCLHAYLGRSRLEGRTTGGGSPGPRARTRTRRGRYSGFFSNASHTLPRLAGSLPCLAGSLQSG